jgi:hypothetical protein
VVWAVDHGGDDITSLMRGYVAGPLATALQGDNEIGAGLHYPPAEEATAAALIDALRERRPALVVTASHGKTGPLGDAAAMGRDLGLPVDRNHDVLGTAELLQQWNPDGAIWYAHACCSAGSDAATIFKGLVEPGSGVDRILEGVAALGARVAPLPTALLGASRPLRAFIGHVEPTFNYTLRNQETGQRLTSTIVSALHDHLYRKVPEPVGMAFEGCYRYANEMFAQFSEAAQKVDDGDDAQRSVALRCQLVGRDRQSMVILGDPTVALPPP